MVLGGASVVGDALVKGYVFRPCFVEVAQRGCVFPEGVGVAWRGIPLPVWVCKGVFWGVIVGWGVVNAGGVGPSACEFFCSFVRYVVGTLVLFECVGREEAVLARCVFYVID